MEMTIRLDDIDLGLVVNLATLRSVLATLSVDGRKWWIASDPTDTLRCRFLTIGHGDRGCVDRLNTLYYRVPALNEAMPSAGPDNLIVLLDSSILVPEQPGLYIEDGRVLEDVVTDMESFFYPIKQALVAMLSGQSRLD
jgi:hypothetical protein